MALFARDFDYNLPPERIAQEPLADRHLSRLMVLRRQAQPEHHVFHELPALLRHGDLLVLNDTLVVPAKFACRRQSGAKIEGLFLREPACGCWEVLLRNAGRCRPGETLALLRADGVRLTLRENLGEGRWTVSVLSGGSDPEGRTVPAADILQQAGTTPLPPYIRRDAQTADGPPPGDEADRGRYQTVYASRPGAVAAPTAGLHFTRPLLAGLDRAGVRTTCVTLHVGLGTFQPVKVERLAEHRMHAEWYELSAEAAGTLNAARRKGRRIVAVGTTSLRVLETAAACGGQKEMFRPAAGWTDLFIYPPAEFRAVDALITNFHLPRSTLLMLVAAFCSPGRTGGVRMILEAYAEAVRLGYRFYSYGDAMLIE